MTIEKAMYWTRFPEPGFLIHPDPPRDFVEACGQNRRPAVTIVFLDRTSWQATLWLGQAHIIRSDGWRGWINSGYLVGLPQEIERYSYPALSNSLTTVENVSWQNWADFILHVQHASPLQHLVRDDERPAGRAEKNHHRPGRNSLSDFLKSRALRSFDQPTVLCSSLHR